MCTYVKQHTYVYTHKHKANSANTSFIIFRLRWVVALSPDNSVPGSLVLHVFLNWCGSLWLCRASPCSVTHPSFETQSLRDSWVSEKLRSSGLLSNRGVELALWCPLPHSREAVLPYTSWQSFLVRPDPTMISCHWSDVLFLSPLEFHFWGGISDLDLEEEENLLEILEFGEMGKKNINSAESY